MLSLGLGLGLSDTQAISVGVGGGYVPQAVSLDGASKLVIDALTATDNGRFVCAYRVKHDSAVIGTNQPPNWVVDPEGEFANADIYNGFAFAYDFTLNEYDGNAGFTPQTEARGYVPDRWHLVCESADVNFSQGNKLGALYIDDMPGNVIQDFGAAFTPGFNTYPFWLASGGEGSFVTGAIADFMMWVGQYLDLSIEGNRTALADPTTAIELLGEPTVWYQRDGAGSTFAANRGTGGAAAFTGSLGDPVKTIALHWRTGFESGFVDATTPPSTVLADIVASGAQPNDPEFISYSEISDPDDKFTVSGSTLILSDTIVASDAHSVTIRGIDTEAGTVDGDFTITAF